MVTGAQVVSRADVQIVVPVVTFVLGIVLGVLLQTWYAIYFVRPKLAVTGGGSGLGPDGYRTNSVTVTNQLGFLGLHFGATSILGKTLHRGARRGHPFPRSAAQDCYGRIFDGETGDLLATLYWQPEAGTSGPWQTAATIPSGHSRSLKLFARLDSEPDSYFVFQPMSDGTPRVPAVKFNGDHRFRIDVSVFAQRVEVEFEGRMRLMASGTLQWETTGGGGGGGF